MLRIQPFRVWENVCSVLQKQLNNRHRAVLTSQVQRHVVGIGDRVDASRLGEQQFDTLEVAVNNGVDEGSKIVVVNQVNSLNVCCIMLAYSIWRKRTYPLPSRRASNMRSRPCRLA